MAKLPWSSSFANNSEQLDISYTKFGRALATSRSLRARCSLSVLALAAVAATGVSTAGDAVAQCNTTTKVCSGTVTSRLNTTHSADVNWTLSANASLTANNAITISSTGNVSLSMQASSSVIVGHNNSVGDDRAIRLISDRSVTLNQAANTGDISVTCPGLNGLDCSFWAKLEGISVSAFGSVTLDLHGDVSVTGLKDGAARGIIAETTNSAGSAINIRSRGHINVTGFTPSPPSAGLTPSFEFTKIGIEAKTNKGNITISANTISSFNEAIDAYTKDGDIAVNLSGAVTATDGDAIEAYTKKGGVSITASGLLKGEKNAIDVKSVSGGVTINTISGAETTSDSTTDTVIKVSATSLGNQAVTISSSGTITTSRGGGVYAHVRSSSSAVTVSVNAITTNNSTIYVNSNGSGSLSVTATGTLETKNTTNSIKAIAVRLKQYGTASVNVKLASVSAANGGLTLDGRGTGTVTVSSSGTISSTQSTAYAMNIQNRGPINVTAKNGYSKHITVGIKNFQGSGTLLVTGNIHASGNNIKSAIRVDANAGAGPSNITVGSSANVTASGTASSNTQNFHALYVRNLGNSATVEVSGNVTSSGHKEQAAINIAAGGAINLDVTTSTAVITGRRGVIAQTNNSNITITNSGSIVGRSSFGNNIGVYVSTTNGGVTITNNGSITGSGSQGFGILLNKAGGLAVITLNSGSTLGTTGAIGSALSSLGNSIDSVEVNSGAVVTGNILLGANNDTLQFLGGTFSGDVTLNGGGGTDTLVFGSNTFALTASRITNWEKIVVQNGATASFDGTSSLTTTEFELQGILSLQDGAVGDTFSVSGILSYSGQIHIDVDFSAGTADSISVGSLLNNKVIHVRDISPSNSTSRSTGPITILTAGNVNSPSDRLRLHGESMLSGGYVYTLVFDSSSKTYSLTGSAATLNCSESPTNTYTCRGAITRREQMIRQVTTALSATLDVSAALGVSANIGIVMTNSGDVTLSQATGGRSLTASGSATGVVIATSTGSGNVSVSLTGAVSLSGAGVAIEAVARTGNVSISTGGSVTAAQSGGTGSRPSGAIALKAVGSGSSVSISTGNSVRGGLHGIYASNTGTGNVTVTTSGTVSAVMSSAIFAKGNGGTVTVNTSGAVTAAGRGIKVLNSGSGAINVNASGTVTATRTSYPRGYAIEVEHSGSGAITISTTSLSGQKRGITAKSNGAGGSITAHVSGDINVTGGAGEGIYARTNKAGDITISVTGSISSTFYAIRVNNYIQYGQPRGSGDVSVTVSGHISNTSTSTRLLNVNHDSTGSLTVNMGSGSATREGVALSTSGDITLTMTGNLTNGGDTNGHEAITAYTTGSITISGKDITSSGSGIYSWISAGNNSTVITVGTISAAFRGIRAGTYGTGSVTLTSSGITAAGHEAIYASSNGGGNAGILITDTGTIKNTGSAADTVYAFTAGNGGITINVSSVEGTQDSIVALNSGNGNVSVTATDTVTAAQSGIFVSNSGTGSSSVTASGTITATSGAGVLIKNSGSTVTVTTVGITAATHGIHVTNSGAGSSTIVVDGAVSVSGANAVYGIYVLEQAGSDGASITINESGSVVGKRTGIWTVVNGSGDGTIVTEGAVTGDIHGIDIANSGTGDISLTISGDVTATSTEATASAIRTRTVSGDVTITINGGTLKGTKAIDDDESNTTILVNSGAVISSAITLSAGVDTLTFADGTFNNAILLDGGEDAGTDSSVDVLTLSGGTVSLNAANLRNWENLVVTEDTTISFTSATTTLSVDDLKLSGMLSLKNDTAGDTLNLSGNLSTGGTITLDINFTEDASAVDTISISGNLAGTHTIILNDVTPSDSYQREESINLLTVGGTIDSETKITVQGGEFVSGPYAYVLVFDEATKTYKLTGAKGTLKCIEAVEGNFACSGDIEARERISARDTVDIIVNLDQGATVDIAQDRAFDIQGEGGISFTQAPNGGELKASGTADAILRAKGTGNGSIQIRLTGTATLAGSGTAIQASSSGTGEISVTTVAVIAGNASGTAIKAYGKGRSVTVNATTVSGGQNAIVAKNTGAVGATTVSTTGNVTSSGTGIHAYSLGGAVTVNANVVDGDTVAILAENKNRVSVVTVNTSGTVTSESAAIKAYSDGGGVNVSTSNVTGSSGAIVAKNRIGAGAVAVNSTGTLTTTSGTALYATSQEGAVTINIASATGETGAIFAKSISGAGTVSITTTGNITTTSGSAIYAFSLSGQVSVQANNVSGETNAILAKNDGGTNGSISVSASGTVSASNGAGILASNKGNGALSVETSQQVTGTGSTGDGIHATNDENGTRLSVRVGSVTGQRNAIYALNKGSDTLSITTSGVVAATASSAIHAKSEGEGGISIVIGGTIRGGAAGAAINTLTENQTTNIALNTGATVNAGESGIAIQNDEGTSNVSIRGGSTLSGAVRLGGGVDRVSLQGGNIGTSIIDGGTDGENDVSVDILTVNAGTFALTGGTQSATASQFVNWERITVDSSVSTTVNGNVLLEVDRLEIEGTLSMEDNRPDDSLRVTGTFAGSTTLDIDVNFASGETDTLTVSGSVSGTKFLRINDVSPQAITQRQGEITLVKVNGSVSNNAFSLTGRSILSGGNQYELIFDARTKEFKLAGVSAGGPMLLSAQITFFDGFARTSSLSERRLNRRSLSTDDSGTGRGAWFRQTNSKIDHGLPRNNRSPKFESSVMGLQSGFDLGRFVSPMGTFVYGVTAQYNEVNSDVSVGNSNKGTLSAVGYGVGATVTWYGNDGAYVDFQGQFNDIDADFETDTLGRLMDGTEATATVISAEMGQRYQFTDEVAVTPQAQLSWGQVDVDAFSTNNNQSVRPEAEAGYTLRAGIEAEYGSKQYNGYLLGNLYYDSVDTWELEFVGEKYKDTNGAVSVEFGFGGSTEVSDGAILFLQGSYRITTDSGADRKSSSNLSAGFAFSW